MSSLLPLVLLMVALWAVLILPQNRRRKRAAQMQRSVDPGVRIMTTSGMYGTVEAVEDDALLVEIADGVSVRFAKAAVMRVLPDEVEIADSTDSADENDGADESDGADRVADEMSEIESLDGAGHDVRGGKSASDFDVAHRDGHDGGASPVSTA